MTTGLPPPAADDHRRRRTLGAHRLLERLAAGRAPLQLAAQLVGGDVAGADRAGVHAAAGQLVVEHLRETDHSPLARAVGGVGGAADQTELRGDEHDRAAPALSHARQDALGEPQRGADVKLPGLLEVGRLDVFDEVAVEHAGAADEHVDGAERRDDLIDRAGAFRGIGQIGGDRVRRPADPRGGGVEQPRIACDEADLRAERGEALGARETEPARGSCDQHRLPFEACHRVLLFRDSRSMRAR